MFKDLEKMASHFYNKSTDIVITNKLDTYKIIPGKTKKKINPAEHCISAISASLQYCFWYGDSSFRPVDSQDVDQLVSRVLKEVQPKEIHFYKNNLIEELKSYNITMLPERIQSVKDIFKLDFVQYEKLKENPIKSIQVLLNNPAFNDFFMKKAIYAVARTYRQLGKLSELTIPVPCDYRVPQALEALGLIKYSKQLKTMIDTDVLIPEGSKLEVEIRSATLLACNKLARINKITPNQVDTHLFNIARQLTTKHHLTYTTNY